MAERKRLRNKKIHIWVSESEDKVIKEKAEYCNLTVSDFIRNSAINGAIINMETDNITKAIYEINKIGVNINQIAAKINRDNCVFESDFLSLKKDMENLTDKYILYLIGEK